MMQKITLIGLTALLVLLGSIQNINAQCKSFTKKRCLSELGDYSSNGQYNGAVMFQGEEATLMQTFYSNQKYKLMICSQSSINESLFFEVKDYRNNLLYTSEGTGSNIFEFDVESTQQLKIRIVVPGDESGSQIKKNGCVSVIVGFQE
jgi:hypothetical protein